MLESKEVLNKIVDFLRMRGPSLPIHIAKYMQMNSLFVSAFLSELVQDRKIIASSMRVGGSPLYFLSGQEARLDSFHQHLHPKEVEAYESLKREGILKDADQDPAIRVALRALKDFAIGFKVNEDIYWRYITVKEADVINLLDKKKFGYRIKQEERVEVKREEPKERTQPERVTLKYKREEPEKKIIPPKQITPTKQPIQQVKPKINEEVKEKFENPLIQQEQIKPKTIKEKAKSEFVIKTINFLENNNIRIIEEKEYKAKEYLCITEINSDLGNISFLTQSKDKKSVSELDLKNLLMTAQKIPLPALFVHNGKLSKKAIEYLTTYSSILKAKEMV